MGGAGVGVAMAVTYRERQRKVRAAVCTCCHTRYGATSDPAKCTTNGAVPRPRGPSRAVYAYNGTSHKMFSSYGAISHDHHRRHSNHSHAPSVHSHHAHPPTVHTPILPPSTYTHTLTSTVHPTSSLTPPTSSLPKEKQSGGEGGVDVVAAGGKKKEEEEEVGGRDQQQHKTSAGNNNNTMTTQPDSSSSSSSSVSMTTNSVTTTTNSRSSTTNSLINSQSCSCGAGLRTRQLGWRPRSESGVGMGGRRPSQAATVRSFGGHKRLVMPCRTRPPGHVPVHLFAASSTRATQRDTTHDSDGGNDSGAAASTSPPPRPASPLLDPDVVSLSSECGLLAAEEGDEAQAGRDLIMSPLLGAQKAGKRGQQHEQDSTLDTHQG